MKKFFKRILIVIFVVSFVLFLAISLFLLIPTKMELNLKTLENTSDFVNFYDTHNNLIVSSTSKEFNEKKTDIKPLVKYAFVATEDKNFYSHKGIDFLRMIKAGLTNLKEMSFAQGASTISQQLIKNTQLSSDKTMKRKLTEIKLTQKLEKLYSKDQIITMYLNTIYFGNGCYGIESASKFYFNKSVNDLDLNEITLLVASINSPSQINPIKDLGKAKERQKIVLNRMKDCGYINENDIKNVNSSNTTIYGKKDNEFDFYISCCFDEIKDVIGLSPYEIKDCNIYTGLIRDYQKFIYSKAKDFETDYQSIIIDNSSLLVNSYYSTCGEIERMPASTIKPLLVYAPAIDKNLVSECTIISDEKTNFNGYTPTNFNNKYYGNVTVKDALKLSLNIPSVKILNSVGIENAKNYLDKMNLSTDVDSLSLALGNTDKGYKLKDLAGGFSVFANYGKYIKPHFIKKITDCNGKEIYSFDAHPTKVFKESTASIITDILKECSKSGTAKLLKDLDYEVATKTGTYGNKDGNSDVYSVSYTSDKTIATWLGNSNSSLMDNCITGGGLTTKNNYKLLNEIYSERKPENFKMYGCENLSIDKYLLENTNEIRLASENTPQKYIVDYLFAKDNKPILTSNLFDFPSFKADIKLNDSQIEINVTKPSIYKIKIYKKDSESKRLVYEGFSDKFSETIEYGEFEYSIIAEIKGKNEIKESQEYILPTIRFLEDDDNIDLKPNDWWLDDY